MEGREERSSKKTEEGERTFSGEGYMMITTMVGVGAPRKVESVDLASIVSDISSKVDFNNYIQHEESDLGYQPMESVQTPLINEEKLRHTSINSEQMDPPITEAADEKAERDPGVPSGSRSRKRSVDGTALLLREVQSIRSELTGQSQRTSSSQRLILEKLEDLGDDLQGYGLSSPSFLSPSSKPRPITWIIS